VPAFVGRTEELRVLQHLFAAADDAPAAAVLVGDAGSGKTRLLQEASERTGVPSRFRVTGYEPEQHVPLACAAIFLREVGARSAAGQRLARIVFEDSDRLEPMRVFEAAHRAVEALEPVLLLVDDLQWVDDLSLALCHYLVRAAEAAGQRLVLIAAARPSADASAFSASLRQVLPPDRIADLALGPLSPEESLELIASLEPGLGHRVARTVSTRAGGSPFWLEALVRSGEADAAQLVTTRLRGAGADASSLLALLAVAARPFALAAAGALQGWQPDRVEHAATELVTRGVAVETATGAIRLTHDLVREAAYRDVPEETRRSLHGRLAEWLESIAGDDLRHLREALTHRHAAATPALELALRLARAPRRTLLGDEGLALLAEVADDGDPADSRSLALLTEVAALAAELGHHAASIDRWRRLAEHTTDPLQRASALLAASRSAAALDRREEARAFLEQASAIDGDDDVLELERLTQAATLQLWSQPMEQAPGRRQAYEVARRGRAFAETMGGAEALEPRARRAYLEALRVRYEAAYQDDDVDGLLQTAEERTAVARGFDDEASLTASVDLGRALRRAGRIEGAEQRLRHAWEDARRRVRPQLTIDAAYWLGTVLEQQARIAEADEMVRDAIELAERVGDEARGRHPISRLGHRISFHRGEWRHAVDGLLQARQTASTHAGIEYHQEAALWLALAGGREVETEVVAQVQDARLCAAAAACPRCSTEIRLAAAEALARVGRQDEAAQSLEEWERLQHRPQPRDRVLHRRTQGLLASRNGNGTAIALLESAVDDAERIGLVLDRLWTQIDLGRVVRRVEPERAVELLRSVATEAAKLGALTEQQAAEKELRGLGVRTWRRGAAAEGLSEREQTIVAMIAAGASNPEIAQELFLSRKTVERHVSNVLKKLGARNRAELAAKVGEQKVEGAPR
jgi:DNA-binding CsgD family transcriptional regulator/tetratricopeptide (TPR) repeat protein